jgi:DNA-binding SARP family transcriptional activator/tetratricopeptide (TPR) repeat protein
VIRNGASSGEASVGSGRQGRGRGHEGGDHVAGRSLRFQLVGPFSAWDGTRPIDERELGSRKGRTLLKALLLDADQPVSRDHLGSLLWPEHTPADVTRNLATLVSRLRKVLGAEAIESLGAAYRLRTGDTVAVDLREAKRLLVEARDHLAGGEASLTWTAVERALDLLGDADLLEGESDTGWADAARSELSVLRRDLRRCGWEAALALGDGDLAAGLARASVSTDPLDEEACRALMRACLTRGDVATGLVAFDRLRRTLIDELGVEPSTETRELHLALLREDGTAAQPDAGSAAVDAPTLGSDRYVERSLLSTAGLLGRDPELALLSDRWAAAARGRPSLVLLTGEAGIGKTRLAEEALGAAMRSGGGGVQARCYEAERSLFLGPIVEALSDLARRSRPDRLRDAAHPFEGTLAALVPEYAGLFGPTSYEAAAPRIERRRVFEAIATLLRGLSRHQPQLVVLDDLHNAGTATIELLHYVMRHLAGGRVLVVATLRVEEGAGVLRDLHEVGRRVDVGPLPEEAVAALARAAGVDRLAPRVLELTRGHTLSVIEILEAIGRGGVDLTSPPLPDSLRSAVLQRVERAGHEVSELLRGAAILGSTFDPETVAELLDLSWEETTRRTERAVLSRLLCEDGEAFTFSNDLIREIVYDSIPLPTRRLRHRRAATLLTDRPEAMATHASAGGDHTTALDAWLRAAQAAASRYANRDAEALLQRAIDAGESAGDEVGVARARLARGHIREVLADYDGAYADLEAAAALARSHAQPDIEAAALRALGGDVIVGLGRPSTDGIPYLEAGLAVAGSARLGRIEVELLGRLAVVWSNRARFDLAEENAALANVRAAELGDERARALALDAVKNVAAYLGDVPTLEAVVPELERLLRDAGDLSLLQWAVFESVVPALAAARWDAADAILERALALNRRTGHPWGSLYLAHRSWIRRAQGDYGGALASAREAVRVDTTAGHPWWIAFANAMLGWVLSDIGAQDAAIACLRRGAWAAERDGMESYLVRCVSHLALAHQRRGDEQEAEQQLSRARHLLAGVTVPPGHAFLHGAHAVAAVARVHLARGEHADAEQVLAEVREPAEAVDWVEVVVADRILRAKASLGRDDSSAARALLEHAADHADRSALPPLAAEAHALLAHVASLGSDARTAAAHARAAAAIRDRIGASIEDEELRASYLGSAGPA